MQSSSIALDDTIVAVASAPGPGGRAILRISGPNALIVAQFVFRCDQPIDERKRHIYVGTCVVDNVINGLPAQLAMFPGPNSYTGQDVVELHTVSVPALLDWLFAALLAAGARPAQPGEFTMRAFLAGRLLTHQRELPPLSQN